MTLDDIEVALGQYLAAMTGVPAIAWPNKDFDPDGQYIEFRHSPTERVDDTVSGGFPFQIGLALMTVVSPRGQFSSSSNATAQAIANRFPKGLRRTAGDGNLVINRATSFGTPFQDGAYWRQPVVVSYVTEDNPAEYQPPTLASASRTGWAYYIDQEGAQAFLADERTLLTNDAGVTLDSQKPEDVATFWTGNALQGVDGDDRTMRVQFSVTPDDATTTGVLIELDIGGAQGVIDRKRVPITVGAAVEQEVSEAFELFCGGTFEANGCQVFLTFDGPVSVTGKTVLAKRGHKAR